ncbi:MAG: aldo/keto reductase [Trebonia sp.]
MFARCRNAGINFFDTANVYGDGASETILGKLIAGSRDDLVITSKAFFPTGSDVNAGGPVAPSRHPRRGRLADPAWHRPA